MPTLTVENAFQHADMLISLFAEKIARRRALMRRAAECENWEGAQMQYKMAANLYAECSAIFQQAVPHFDRHAFDRACDILPPLNRRSS